MGKKSEKYNAEEVEKKWQEYWEKKGIYKFDENSSKPVFSVDTPPPTVSGKMHIGHAFSYSQQDFLVRYKRMKGYNIFYPFGTDDNGIPTERLVERRKKVNAKDMPRQDFIKLCMSFLKEELPKFIYDWKRLGISCDFDKYYSTINEHSRKISQRSFTDLYKKGLIERKEAPAIYCPECQTGISQAETEDKKVPSQYNHLVFKVDNEGKEEDLVIATTRPELLPACVAIFYHPEDKRFIKYKGKKAKVPLFDFEVPILEDERADPEKGTGSVMCCTFGDQTDMEWQQAHNLPIKEAITEEGKMSEIAEEYEGLSVKDTRKKIIQDLEKKGLLKKQEPIEHEINVHERCGSELEFIKIKQWFVNYLDMKEKMLGWGDKLNWYPEFMKVRYDNWVKGLQWDWLISRQRYFGIPFPLWYCKECGEVKVAEEKDLPVDPMKDNPKEKCKCGSSNFEAEKDVLDTWFTSSMTPRIAVELMPKEQQEKLFPMSLRPQAHEIINFWLFKTVVKSNLHFGKNPFKDVAVSGFVLDEKGEKMSKSKGNVVEPQKVFEEYGVDAFRYWASGSKLGKDVPFKEKDLVSGKKFVKKIFNASKFVFMNVKDKPKKPGEFEEVDRIFLTRLNDLIEKATKNFDKYEYSNVKHDVDNFFWNDFCDNYLEIVKNRVYNGSKNEKNSAFFVLYNSLLSIVKMFSPITPFVTEEIWNMHFKDNEEKESIHVSEWPGKFKIKEKKEDKERYDLMLDIIGKVRNIKSENNKSVKVPIILTLKEKNKKKLGEMLEDLKSVVNAQEIKTGEFGVEFVRE